MMIVMWKTERGDALIDRVECTRATSESIWFMRRQFVLDGPDRAPVEVKAARNGAYVDYHSTWEEAHENLRVNAEFAVQAKLRQLDLANSHHGNVKGLRKPAEVAVG